MKNRTVIGIVCIILSVCVTFFAAPFVNRLTSNTTAVIRLKQDVGKGVSIKEEIRISSFAAL